MDIRKSKVSVLLTITALAGVLGAGGASATVLSFDLSNKGRGAIADPDYGLRLDDLFTSPTDSNWTFAFGDNGASVQMDVDTDDATVHIFGTVFGGRDTGGSWDPDTAALWNLDFTYSEGVTIDDPSQGFWSVASDEINDGNTLDNFGFLQLVDAVDVDGMGGTDEGMFIGLADYHGGSFVGTGGPRPQGPFVSAWLASTDALIASNADLANETYTRPNGGNCCNDFGFRATQSVPEPSSLALLALGAVAGLRRVRRQRPVANASV